MMESVVWWILWSPARYLSSSFPSWYYLTLLDTVFPSPVLLVTHHSSRFSILISVPFLPQFFSSPFLLVLVWSVMLILGWCLFPLYLQSLSSFQKCNTPLLALCLFLCFHYLIFPNFYVN